MKKILLTLSTLATFGITSYSQITYHDINPDTTVNTWNAFIVKPPNGISSDDIVIWWHPSPEVVVQTHGDCEILFNGTLPSKLNLNDSISATGNWKPGNYDALNNVITGNWKTDATDKYLGFRFKKTNVWHYGWLKMSIASGAVSYTVKEWAFNSQAGKTIKAGQTTTTGMNTIIPAAVIKIYPNPAQDYIQLQYKAIDNTVISITNANGSTIKTTEISKGADNPLIDTRDLARGVYQISIRNGTDNHTQTIIKQ